MKINSAFKSVYLVTFALAMADAVTAYWQSSYLNQFVSLSAVGAVLAAGSLLTILAAGSFHRLIMRLANWYCALILIILAIGGNLILVWSNSAVLVIIAFILRYLSIAFLASNLDIFLEKISNNQHTGVIRAKFLTIYNLAWLLSPWLASRLIAVDNNYRAVYLASAIILGLALIFLLLNKARLYDRVNYKRHDFRKALRLIWQNKNLFNIWRSSIVLNLFYAIAVLYIPLYLRQTMDLSWTQLGIAFTIMLLPFVLFQLPAGALADKCWGEKEMLLIGHGLMALSLICVFLISSSALWVWALILFISRVGAALAESMQEIYFYKKVSVRDVDLINLYRRGGAIGWLLGAGAAFILLPFITLPYLFLLIAGVIIINLLSLAKLVDTK